MILETDSVGDRQNWRLMKLETASAGRGKAGVGAREFMSTEEGWCFSFAYRTLIRARFLLIKQHSTNQQVDGEAATGAKSGAIAFSLFR